MQWSGAFALQAM